MKELLIILTALTLNVAAFVYLRAWTPVVAYVKAAKLSRQVKAFRNAGLL